VWTVEHRSVPVLTTVVLLDVGSAVDPPQRPGLASLTGDMLDEGAGNRSALDVNDALGRIGAQFDTEVGPDATILTLTTLSRFRDQALGLLADIVCRPQFDTNEFERVRQLRMNRLRQLRDLAPAVADRAFASAIYAEHPYGHLAIGTEQALQQISLQEVTEFHRRAYRPADTTIVVVGDGTHDELRDAVRGRFGGWIAASGRDAGLDTALRQVLDAPVRNSVRSVLVDRPAAAQSELRIGHLGVSRSCPDYHALLVLNMVLGGQFVSRLNMNLREDKGYTYGARTSFDFRRGPGPFQLQVSVQTGVTGAAIGEVLSELRAARGERPVDARELELARASLTRGYPRNFETADQIARSVAQLALYGLADDYFEQFVPTVAALDLEVMKRVAATYLQPDRLTTVVVGDRSAVEPQLGAIGLSPQVVMTPEAIEDRRDLIH
jgi:zinc protease